MQYSVYAYTCTMLHPAYAVYIQGDSGTIRASAAAENGKHMTEVNDFADVFIHVGTNVQLYFCHICRTAVGMLGLAVGLEEILKHLVKAL